VFFRRELRLDHGDGSGQFFAAVNPQLKKLDNGAGEYIAQVIGSTGYSRGEDN